MRYTMTAAIFSLAALPALADHHAEPKAMMDDGMAMKDSMTDAKGMMDDGMAMKDSMTDAKGMMDDGMAMKDGMSEAKGMMDDGMAMKDGMSEAKGMMDDGMAMKDGMSDAKGMMDDGMAMKDGMSDAKGMMDDGMAMKDMSGDDMMHETTLKAVALHADWCGKCQTLGPKVTAARAANEFEGVEFIKLDYTDRDDAAFFAKADEAGVGEAVRGKLQGSVKTGMVLLVNAETGKLVKVIKSSYSPKKIARKINAAAKASM